MIEVAGGDEALGGAADAKRAPASSSNKIRLSPDEERIYRKVDGTRTVNAVIDATGLGEFEVCRTLFDLLNRNIIAPTGRGTTPAAQAEEPESIVSATPGYVVMALALVLAVAGVVAQARSPFAVTGLPALLRTPYVEILESVSATRLQRLDRGLQAYVLLKGAPPRTLEELVQAGLVDARYLKDPSNRPYHYVPSGAGYTLNAVDDNGRTLVGTVIERAALGTDRP
jgi:hypothetical protein